MKCVYILKHNYEKEHIGEIYVESKFLGAFSTRERAESIIEKYKNLPGYKEHPLDCFYIEKHQINKNYWEEGFSFNN